MLCHGPVWVPEDARAGDAIVRVEFSAASAYKSFATDLPVKIE